MNQIHFIICEICGEYIARTKPSVKPLTFPMDGSMFFSPKEANGWPHPFDLDANLGWEDLLCPHCHKHFAIEPDRVQTTNGVYILPKIKEVTDRKQEEEKTEERASEKEVKAVKRRRRVNK